MKIALVGNQNSGKTTLFNLLTGMNAKIGNWPGVTIEKKTGYIKASNDEITDLPGIYSLSPYSIEEEVSRKFIFEENPDVIINIIDSTSLERSLYLTTQLLETDCKIIIALNMTDILAKKGIQIDVNKLEEQLGSKVIEISALKQTGINELITEIHKHNTYNRRYIYDSYLENSIKEIEYILTNKEKHLRFSAIKLLEDDDRFKNLNNNKINLIKTELSKKYDTDIEEVVATQRYKFIENVKKECEKKLKIKEDISDKLDKIFLNKWVAFPIFILIMFLIYYLSVGVIGNLTIDFVSNVINYLGENVKQLLENIGASKWLVSLIVDGIIAGVGSVLSFIPQLIILFISISILETSGYMSRIALLLDKLFRRIGLSGKSLIPFIVGSGCSVPGIMGTRIIENQDEREMTTILTPFIPCSAKLPIIALFSGYFFGKNSGIVSASLYFLAIIIIIVSAIIMKKFVFKNTSSTYISELPEYKLPNAKYVIKDVFEKVISFIKRAGSIILVCSIVIWFLLSFSFKFEYGVNINESILSYIGRAISWIFYPILGVNSWEATVSAIQGLIAKEQVISSMSVIAGFSEKLETQNRLFVNESCFNFFTPASAYAFMVFNLFSAPCFGAIAAMEKELNGIKKVLKVIIFQICFAWFFATVVYQIGIRIENHMINYANILVIGIIIMILIIIFKNIKKDGNAKCRNCPYCNSCDKR